MVEPRRVWWIASYPKSGNTWIRYLVDAYVTQAPCDINRHWGRWVKGDLQPVDMQRVCPWPVKECSIDVLAELRSAALLQAIAAANGSDICLKTHHGRFIVSDYQMCPDWLTKGAVYIVRDPRDVACSWAAHTGLSLDEAIEFMNKQGAVIRDAETGLFHAVGTWSKHVQSWTSRAEKPAIIIRYEDVLGDTKSALRVILQALGIREPDEKRLQFAVKQCRFENLRRQEDKDGFVEKKQGEHFFRTGQAGDWMNTLTMEQARRIRQQHAVAMAIAGYK